jgi:hypothetical protein
MTGSDETTPDGDDLGEMIQISTWRHAQGTRERHRHTSAAEEKAKATAAIAEVAIRQGFCGSRERAPYKKDCCR